MPYKLKVYTRDKILQHRGSPRKWVYVLEKQWHLSGVTERGFHWGTLAEARAVSRDIKRGFNSRAAGGIRPKLRFMKIAIVKKKEHKRRR